jgi:hypothetical protein
MARNDLPPPGGADDPTGPDPGPGEPGGGGGAGRAEAGGAGGAEAGGAGGGAGGAEAGGAESPEHALRRLNERLDRASDAAERLIAESAARASSAFRRPPPAGWQAPPSEQEPGRSGDLDLLVQLLDSLRELIPAELQQRLAEALKELLLAVRALINWYLERLDRHQEEPTEVEDIPISWD